MPLFQADSEQLQEIARTFQAEADCVDRVLRDLINKTDNLRGRGWIGLGAEAYYDEFDSRIKPGLTALIRFLETQYEDASKVAAQVEQAAERIIASAKSQY